MNRKAFRLVLTGTIGLLLAGGLSATEVVTSSVSRAGIGLDTRKGVLRKITSSQVDLFGLAYNNTTNWTLNGDSGKGLPTLRIVEMDAHGTPTLVTNWTDTIAITNFPFTDREGVKNWVSDRMAFYRAELLVGDATNAVAYFDFSTCSDPGIRKTLSCFTDAQAFFVLRDKEATKLLQSVSSGGNAQYELEGQLYETNGTPVGVENFTLSYDASQAYPGNLLDVYADGINTWGGTALFQSVPMFVEKVVSSNSVAKLGFDTRRKLVYVDATIGSKVHHVDTVTLHVVTNSAVDLHDFAYNNTTNWLAGGDSGATLAHVHVVEMDAHGLTDYPPDWTDTSCETNFPISVAEGTRDLTSDRRAFYRVELMVGDATNAVVYFDFSGCTDAGIKKTLSCFAASQIQAHIYPAESGGWDITGTVKDGDGNTLTMGTDYVFAYGNPFPLWVQGVGTEWGGRNLVTSVSYGEGVVSVDRATAPFDTRKLTWRFWPETGTGRTLYWCRHPDSAAEILPFAYDTDWVATATAIDSVSITAYAYDELDEGRREQVTVTNTVGTGIWEPAYKGYYEARIIETVPSGLATNVVEIDLGEETMDLPDYPGIDVAFDDGTVTNYLTLQVALQAARKAQAAGAEVESVNLLVDRYEDLVLQAGDDIVLDATGHTLVGGFEVPESAELAILGGSFTTNPEQPDDPDDPYDYVPRGCSVTSAPAEAPTLWTVTPKWLVGATTPSDIKAYLKDDGTLKVIGSGDMKYWMWSWTKVITPPWDSDGYDSAITNVAVGSRVTSIGSEAFRQCVNLQNVRIPGTIRDIGREAFLTVNTNAQGSVFAAGFVNVTYKPVRADVPADFDAKEMRMANGLLTGGTYTYEPATAEVDPHSCVLDNKNNSWSVVEIWATIERDGTLKYGSGESALAAVDSGETITIESSTPYLKASALNAAFDKEDFVIAGSNKVLDVWGTIERGVYACAVRIGQYNGKAVAGEIAGGTYSNAVYASTNTISGGDFYGPVYAATNTICGGTFSECPSPDQLKAGYGIVETNDEPTRYQVVAMPANGVPYPRIVPGLSYREGVNQIGVLASNAVTLVSGATNATDVGIYTAAIAPADGRCWPTGTTETVTLTWGIAPLLPGVQTGYDPATGGWKITLTNDLTSPLEIPDSFGELVGGTVELDLNGYSIAIPKAVQPGETNGVSAVRIVHTPDYAGAALDLTITGPGTIAGGDGADGVATHTAGGTGAAAIEIGSGAVVEGGATPAVPDDVTATKGADGADYVPGGDEPSDHPLLMSVIDSRDEYLAIAIPYANTNDWTGATKPTLDSLVRKTELAVGDEAYVYNHAKQTISKYRLDDAMDWKPVKVIEVTVNGWRTTVGDDVCTLDYGYGLWLHRGTASRANKVYVWGYKPSESFTVSITGGTETKVGKTLIGNPYVDTWDINDTTRFDWSAKAAVGDQIQVYGGASSIYQWTGSVWKKMTLFTKDTKIPPGFGCWYIRAKGAGAMELTF